MPKYRGGKHQACSWEDNGSCSSAYSPLNIRFSLVFASVLQICNSCQTCQVFGVSGDSWTVESGDSRNVNVCWGNVRVVSACHSDQNRSLGAAPALPVWARELSAPSHLLQWRECHGQKGQGSFAAIPVRTSRKRTVEVMGGCQVMWDAALQGTKGGIRSS